MKIHNLDVDQALAAVRSTAAGLTAPEAARRFAEFGPNVIPVAKRRHVLRALAREYVNFFALILWVAAALAFVAAWWQPGAGMGALGWAIVVVIFINGTFSFIQQYRAERALDALQRLLPEKVCIVREGRLSTTPADRLVPGDVLELTEGERVPADARVIAAESLRLNNATLTGESVPVERSAGPSSAASAIDAENLVFAGTFVYSGVGRAVVFATGGHTEFGRIAAQALREKEPETPIQREVRRMSRIVAMIAVGLGVFFFFLGGLLGFPLWFDLLFAIGLIVANVPEGLLPTLTLSLAMASQRMARRNALVRHLSAIEALGSASVICTDKTGTLTENRMTVETVFLPATKHEEQSPPRSLAERVYLAAWLCHDLRQVESPHGAHWEGDPMELALHAWGERGLAPPPRAVRLGEIPFDTSRRRLTTRHAIDGSVVALVKGAPETVLSLCRRIRLEAPRELDDAARAALQREHEALAARGLRVLAVASSEGPPEERSAWEGDLTFEGFIGMGDPIRASVPDAIARCRTAGIRVVMVTGDHPRTAAAIAHQAGLCDGTPEIITGDEVRHWTDTQLQLRLDRPDIHFARLAPEDKTRLVAALRRKGHVVAVTGDGVNDAPALRLADVGIAMGEGGTDVARGAADIVLLDDNFATIVAAVEEGRAVFANIRNFLGYIFTSNVPELVPYLLFVLLRIPLPLTVMQILAVDLGTDLAPALALGAERPSPETMHRPPRKRDEPLLTRRTLLRAYLVLGPIEALGGLAAYSFVLFRSGWAYGETLSTHAPVYLQATTACLAGIVLCQVANLFVFRERSLRRRSTAGNPLIAIGLAVEIAILFFIVYVPLGHALTGTAAIGWQTWLVPLPFMLILFVVGRLTYRFGNRLAK